MTDPVPVAVADTSGLIAFFNETDKHHEATRVAVAATGHLVVSPCVLTELDYLLATRQGPPTANSVLGYIAGRVAAGRWEVPQIGPLLLVALAREFRTDVIATLDYRHFRMIRPLTPHDAFRLLPADIRT
jgi:uncharacterized protein